MEDGEEQYHVSVYTSWESKGRFTGTVSLQLFGVRGDSLPIELIDGERQVGENTVSTNVLNQVERVLKYCHELYALFTECFVRVFYQNSKTVSSLPRKKGAISEFSAKN